MEAGQLADSSRYILYHEYETPILREKGSGAVTVLPDHYGDPSCGIIDPREQWCIVGGEGCYLYFIESRTGSFFLKEKSGACFIDSIRLTGTDTVEIIVDPWSDQHGTWQLNILPEWRRSEICKISEQPDRRGESRP